MYYTQNNEKVRNEIVLILNANILRGVFVREKKFRIHRIVDNHLLLLAKQISLQIKLIKVQCIFTNCFEARCA